MSPTKGFLFPVTALSRVFRGKFVAGLDGLRLAGRLAGQVAMAAEFQCLRQPLYRHDWAVHAKQPLRGPEAVLDDLARYAHRVAISNERIAGIAGEDVLLRVRTEDECGAFASYIARTSLHIQLPEMSCPNPAAFERCAGAAQAPPTASIPGACGDWAETLAAYRFFAQARADKRGLNWQSILQPHIDCVIIHSPTRLPG